MHKPKYMKPQIVASYTKTELKAQFKELQGATAFVDSFVVDLNGMYLDPNKKKTYRV